MASSIVKALQRFPDAQMVVIAGNGHVMNAWGIPGRVKRRGDYPFSIVLTGSEGGSYRLEKGIADYVLYTRWIDPPETVRLGVLIKKTDNGVRIERVVKGGPADRAGIPEGAIIVSIDGEPVGDVEDIKIALIDKLPGDKIKVKYMDRVLLFYSTKEVEVEL